MVYKAKRDGSIIGKRGYPLRLFIKPNGYLHFSQSNGYGNPNQTLVHRFVYEYFIGNIPGDLCIDHINGDRLDNRLDNLRLVTQQENIYYGKSTKLTKQQVGEIKSKICRKETTQRNIAKNYNISEQVICDIKMGRYWTHIKEGTK